MKLFLIALSICCLGVGLLPAQQSSDHHQGVTQRGEAHEGMGFSQTTTTHHFLLTKNGGIIQVTVNDADDMKSVGQVQSHIKKVAGMFAEGDFSVPHFVHDQTPPGVKTMRAMKTQIHYSPEMLKNGARMLVESNSPEAVEAIHQFLRFQIEDHVTGDPGTVEKADSK